MVGAPLDQDVARAQHAFALVQQGPDLALENDRVVQRVGLVKPEMAWISGFAAGAVRVGAPDLAEHLCDVGTVIKAVGGKSATRRIVPPGAGPIGGTNPAGAASSLPAFDAGVASVIHSTRAMRSGMLAGALQFGAGPSLTITERPRSSCPVTTRRTGVSFRTGGSAAETEALLGASFMSPPPRPRTGWGAAPATTDMARARS